MKNQKVYLTFPTDKETSEFLKEFAKMCRKTQPELINEICHDFIEMVMKTIEDKEKSTT